MSATRERFLGILLLLLAVLMGLSLLAYSPADPPRHSAWPPNPECRHPLGLPGAWTAYALYSGLGFVALPLLLGLLWSAVHLLRGRSVNQIFLRTLGVLLLLVGGSGLAALLLPLSPGTPIGAGGYLGAMAKYMLLQRVTETGAFFFLGSTALAGIILAYDGTLLGVAARLSGRSQMEEKTKPLENHGDKAQGFSAVPVSPAVVATSRPSPVQNTVQPVRQAVGQVAGAANGPGKKLVTPSHAYNYEKYDEYDEYDEDYEDGEEYGEDYEDDYDENECVDEDECEEWAEREEGSETAESGESGHAVEMQVHFPQSVSTVNPSSDAVPQSLIQVDTTPKEQRSGGLFGWLFSGGNRNGSAGGTGENGTATSAEEPGGDGESHIEEETGLPPEEAYTLPPLEILTPSPPFDYAAYEVTVKRQARMLEEAFHDFGFNVKVVDIQTGPVIAQFEIQLEKGLRVNKIQGLTDDLAIALKAPSVRILAPLPGKNTVGVEVPNPDRQIVRLRDVMEQSGEAISEMAIPIYLGMDVSGRAMPIDMAKMPHLLIAGRTGTGKSVCLNSIIVSMLMTRRPDEVKMLMIDPKQVELSPYKTIPHLMHPVVTDMRKAEAILGWAVDKMEERYQLLACAGVRQLSEYNKLDEEELYRRIKPATTDQWDAVPKKMPYLVIVADEMSDLMLTGGKEVETHIIRLAQKSRAVGIHLILATQKPTVDVITGLIKSNLPARIAFGVASRSDSMVVIDRVGAEKLLGYGDMLFLGPGTSQVIRGQGTYVSDAEIEAIIEEVSTVEQEFAEELAALDALDDDDGFWEDYDADDADEGSGEIGGRSAGKAKGKSGGKIQRDELYARAVEYVIGEGRGSVSLLQRKLGIGYGRASRMIDFMAKDGVVGEHNGSQARDVIISLSQWKRRMAAEVEDIDRPKKPRKAPAKSSGGVPASERKASRYEPEPKPGRRRSLRRDSGHDRYEDEYEQEYDEPVRDRRRSSRNTARDADEDFSGDSAGTPRRRPTTERSPRRSPQGTPVRSPQGSPNRSSRNSGPARAEEPVTPKRKRPSLPARIVVSDAQQPIRESRPQRGTRRVGRASYYDYETEPYENYPPDDLETDAADVDEWDDAGDYDADEPPFDTDEDY